MTTLPIIERIKRDHFANSFASQTLVNELKQLRHHDWEADLVLQEIKDLADNPRHPLYGLAIESSTNSQFIKELVPNLSNNHPKEKAFGLIPSEREALIEKIEDGILKKYCDVESFIMGDKLAGVSDSRHKLGVAAADADGLRSTVEKIQNELQQRQFEMPLRRIRLTRLVVECIKLMLEVLDTTWSIMEEFRLKHEKDMNTVYDEHLGVMVDSIILKTKILHISVLLTTYDKPMVPALESLRTALEKQHQEAQAELSFANKQIEAYHDMGPEFNTLASAYFGLLSMIQDTEDDIRRINNA